MANEQHLKILRQGVGAWNDWRRSHRELQPDLRGANFYGADLNGVDLNRTLLRSAKLARANLHSANLTGADLRYTRFTSANLTRAVLICAILSRADLGRADLGRADLNGAGLLRANLADANLDGANLNDANFDGANLAGAVLSRAYLRGTNFSNTDLRRTSIYEAHALDTVFDNIDFRGVEGLESVQHSGPSGISSSTVRRSKGQIPEVFLRGCGLDDWEIEATKLYRTDLSRNQLIEVTYRVIDLRADPLIQFNSCFISYSSKDEEFASCLHTDLQESGVRCWFAPKDMRIGDRMRNRIDDSIRLHDKLLLILSETSITSQWIEQEVETALEKEQEQACDVLFPVRLDDTVMKVRSGWPALIRKTRHIGNFCQWKNVAEYKKGLKRLLDDLRVVA